jgi:hypothetical protein
MAGYHGEVVFLAPEQSRCATLPTVTFQLHNYLLIAFKARHSLCRREWWFSGQAGQAAFAGAYGEPLEFGVSVFLDSQCKNILTNPAVAGYVDVQW